jgi:hypothetical protein
VGAAAGFEALVHALLALRALPPATRAAWRALFEHYVFSDSGGNLEHIPPERRGVLGTLSTEDAARVRAYLAERLQAWT